MSTGQFRRMHEQSPRILRSASHVTPHASSSRSSRNRASIRTLERLGFVREGLLRERWCVAGEVQDALFYGLLRREWEARPRR